MKDIPDMSVDMVLCDPPYGINYQSKWRPKQKRFEKIENDKKPFVDFIGTGLKKIKNTGCLMIFTKWTVQGIFIEELKKHNARSQNVIIWDKITHGMGDLKRAFGNRYESIIFYAKPDFRFTGKRPVDIIQQCRVNPNKLIHPNEKPVELLANLIIPCVKIGGIILDPCMGSGSTGVACLNTNRDFIGIELDDNYFEIAKKRIEEHLTDRPEYSERFSMR